jgi:hypothetical protein
MAERLSAAERKGYPVADLGGGMSAEEAPGREASRKLDLGSREMGLAEWVSTLPASHRACREYAELTAEIGSHLDRGKEAETRIAEVDRQQDEIEELEAEAKVSEERIEILGDVLRDVRKTVGLPEGTNEAWATPDLVEKRIADLEGQIKLNADYAKDCAKAEQRIADLESKVRHANGRIVNLQTLARQLEDKLRSLRAGGRVTAELEDDLTSLRQGERELGAPAFTADPPALLLDAAEGIVWVNGVKHRGCPGEARTSDGRCDQCGAPVLSSGRCNRMLAVGEFPEHAGLGHPSNAPETCADVRVEANAGEAQTIRCGQHSPEMCRTWFCPEHTVTVTEHEKKISSLEAEIETWKTWHREHVPMVAGPEELRRQASGDDKARFVQSGDALGAKLDEQAICRHNWAPPVGSPRFCQKCGLRAGQGALE